MGRTHLATAPAADDQREQVRGIQAAISPGAGWRFAESRARWRAATQRKKQSASRYRRMGIRRVCTAAIPTLVDLKLAAAVWIWAASWVVAALSPRAFRLTILKRTSHFLESAGAAAALDAATRPSAGNHGCTACGNQWLRRRTSAELLRRRRGRDRRLCRASTLGGDDAARCRGL